jgi:hypothetical protein
MKGSVVYKICYGLLYGLFVWSLIAAQSTERVQEQDDSAKAAEKTPEKADAVEMSTKLKVIVTGDDDKPVAGGQVDILSEEENVQFHRVMRTDGGGVVEIVVPRGKVRIQVVAQHWNSSGVRRKLEGEQELVSIKLTR